MHFWAELPEIKGNLVNKGFIQDFAYNAPNSPFKAFYPLGGRFIPFFRENGFGYDLSKIVLIICVFAQNKCLGLTLSHTKAPNFDPSRKTT